MCPDHEVLSAYFDGEVPAPWARELSVHVTGCERCTARLAGMERTRRALSEDEDQAWRSPMERVRRRILSHVPSARPRVALWRRHVSIPAPVAVLAAALLVFFGISFAVLSMRQSMGFIRITKAPTGGTEYQFAVPYDKVEALLKSVGGSDANIESVMTIPKNVKLMPVGEPRMGKAAEFLRQK